MSGPESSPGNGPDSSPDSGPENGPEAAEQRPLLRVIRGDATPEEIAALVAVVASLGAPEPSARPRRPEWNAPYRLARRPLHPGPGAWRASALPH